MDKDFLFIEEDNKEVNQLKVESAHVEGTFPYFEITKSPDFDKDSLATKNELKATALFSTFTADIIKEEKLFIR